MSQFPRAAWREGEASDRSGAASLSITIPTPTDRATGPLLRPNQRQNNNNPFIIILFCCFAALHTQIESLAVSRGLTLSYTATVSLYSPLPTLSCKCIPPNKWRFISFLTASIIQPGSFIIRIINILIGPINQNKKGGMCLEDCWFRTQYIVSGLIMQLLLPHFLRAEHMAGHVVGGSQTCRRCFTMFRMKSSEGC